MSFQKSLCIVTVFLIVASVGSLDGAACRSRPHGSYGEVVGNAYLPSAPTTAPIVYSILARPVVSERPFVPELPLRRSSSRETHHLSASVSLSSSGDFDRSPDATLGTMPTVLTVVSHEPVGQLVGKNDIEKVELALRGINQRLSNAIGAQLAAHSLADKKRYDSDIERLRRERQSYRLTLQKAVDAYRAQKGKPSVGVAACAASRVSRTHVSVAIQSNRGDVCVDELRRQLGQRDRDIAQLQFKLRQRCDAKRTLADVTRERAEFLNERNKLAAQKQQLEESVRQSQQVAGKAKADLDNAIARFEQLLLRQQQETVDSQATCQRYAECLQQWQQCARSCNSARMAAEQRLLEAGQQLELSQQELQTVQKESPCSFRGAAWAAGVMVGVWTVFAHWDLYTSCQK